LRDTRKSLKNFGRSVSSRDSRLISGIADTATLQLDIKSGGGLDAMINSTTMIFAFAAAWMV
jgi:hypothetical protein